MAENLNGMRWIRHFLVLAFFWPALCGAQQLVNCAPGVPCDPASGPSGTATGDPAWKAFGKINANANATSSSSTQTLTNKSIDGTTNSLSNIFSKNIENTLYADQFPGGDMSIKIGNCLVALYSVSTTSGVCKAYFSGAQIWSVNPFSYAGVDGVNFPLAGTLEICGPTTMTYSVPIVVANRWKMISCAGAIGGGAPIFIASATFQPTYTTGTITKGTAGQGDIITGSGTTWASKMVGCSFVAPATQPTDGSLTFGIIHAVTSTTSLTLGQGLDSGPGAAPGSTYAIYCGSVVMGDAYTTGYSAVYISEIAGFTIDCNNVAGCMALQNWFSEEGSTAHDLVLQGYTNIGFDLETVFAQNSGPYYNINFYPGSSCTAATISYVSRTGVPHRPLLNSTLNNPNCSTQISLAADIQTNGEILENLHIENAAVGIAVGANTSCAVSCPSPPIGAAGAFIENINAAGPGGTVVVLSNALTNAYNDTLHNIYGLGGSGWTNALTDAGNSCTVLTAVELLATYELSTTGAIINSSSSSCPPNVHGAYPTISSGFGTGAYVQNALGPASFAVNVGTGGSASSGVVGLSAALHRWACSAQNNTNNATTVEGVVGGQTTVTITNYGRVSGTAVAWTASDLVTVQCTAQ